MRLGVSLKVNLITSAKFSKRRKKKLDFFEKKPKLHNI